ncbi:hypothetical protein P280DRAFT_280852 [Massarina eburnea CBS 473.64]|uniref:BCAS3 domain-containing protein n=1 Tax=Massarina eburnea CBS 473.64 TaxID=1395130 RepID=A0A6A6S1B5_9PLEO|nr:hypothetical protein P280DRAFT_280852 [Massarina eburnea CBS 473.64]
MSPSPDAAADPTHPVSNLTYLHQQHRARTKALDSKPARGRNTERHELGRRDRREGRVTRIYPRQITKSPPTAKRYSSTSPTGPVYNATTSPLLSALGATKTAAQYTNEWTKSLPFFANQPSPGNGGIAINGSPDGLYGPAAASNSPPAPGIRAVSHPNHYTSFGGRMQGSPLESPGRDRRASLYSQPGVRTASGQFARNPPLPHQPQAHFYGLPALDDFGLNNLAAGNMTQTAGEGGYYCGFDTLSMAGDEAARSAENVLLVGCQGGVDVFRVEKGKMDIVGRLEGLRGAVIGAKLLPWTARHDPLFDLRPLIALTIHGPVVTDSRSSNSGSSPPSVVDDSSDSPSRPGSRGGNGPASQVLNYQTTVEVYSLKAKQRLAVLYQSPFVPVTSPFDSPLFQPPPPVGDFVVDAKGKFVVVASGASGEVFIFAPHPEAYHGNAGSFRCIGKVWTTVQFRERTNQSSTSSAADGSHEEVAPEKYGVPVFSLSDRWLAVTPPASTALRSMNGVALVSPYYERPPGLTHHTVPPQPLPNCAVDAPEVDSLVNRLTREGTQVAIKGARWATEKGIQAFKSYMNKNPQANMGINSATYGTEPAQHYFPPTHGHNQAQPRQESSVISIYDLQRLQDAEETKNKNALHAIATIPAAQGCSFLSFSPSGLMLMTISRKGDLQDVWDLKRMNFRRARKTTREQPSGPHVRQIARFARMTVSHVVDVVWSTPRIDKLAVITDKGTVHMFLMPASAFQWPPHRRIRKANEATKPKEDGATAGRGGAVNSAMQAINGTAMPFFNAMRPRTTSNGSRFTLSSLGMTPAAGAKSGKAVAAGVGKSINNIRHAGDNKLTLPSSLSGVKPNSVRWLTGKGRGSIALIGGGALQIYRVQMRPATAKGKSANATSISKTKSVEFGLAPIYDALFSPCIDAQLNPRPEEPDSLQEIHGEWLPRLLPSRRGKTGTAVAQQLGPSPAPLSFSEIETNPPYQPFYTDRRVTRFVFSRMVGDLQNSNIDQDAPMAELVTNLHHENDDSPWLFGQDVEAIRISSPATQQYDSGDDDFAARFENKLVLRDGEEDAGKVVSTTRRRRVRKEGAEEDEDGFFEDDCEVLDFAEDRV